MRLDKRMLSPMSRNPTGEKRRGTATYQRPNIAGGVVGPEGLEPPTKAL